MRKNNYGNNSLLTKTFKLLASLLIKTSKPKVGELSKEEMAKKIEKQAKELKEIKAKQKKIKKIAQGQKTQEQRKTAYERGKKTGKRAGEKFASGVEKLFKNNKPKKAGIRR